MTDENNLRVHRKDFKIPQIVKLAGIRQVKKQTKVPRFISPIFGKRVPDETIIPRKPEVIIDKDKRYDAFRHKPKLTKEEKIKQYGREYYEFGNIITNQSRMEYVGGRIVEDDSIKEEQKYKKVKKLRPIGFDKFHQEEETKEEIPFKVYPNKPKIISQEPIEKTDDSKPKPQVFSRPSKMTYTSDFGDIQVKQELKEDELIASSPIHKKERSDYFIKKEYIMPSLDMFSKIKRDTNDKPPWLLEQIRIINKTLDDFSIEGEVIGSTKGPTVTRYEVSLKPGINVNRVSNISDNLMMALEARSLRIEAPIPGKPYVGLELPNVDPEIVAFGNVVDDPNFYESTKQPLKVALGVDIDGNNVYIDIAKMPHGLIAGATNSGKSVTINTILVSLLLKNNPEQLKMILIDPKMVELAPYNDLPHLITPVITDPKMAAHGLEWAVDEMEKRYVLFASNKSRDITSFNEKVAKGQIDELHMPYIVIVIDELADLMLVASNDVEDSIQRLTQKARAAGIHLLVATQRPTIDVVKGTIKSNIPSRIAFRVASHVDSTTILDGAGAEKLLGKGDMLLKTTNGNLRLQGAYIPDDEIYAVTDFIRANSKTNYLLDHEELLTKSVDRTKKKDELFNEVAKFVVSEGKASINRITQEFSISFNRASAMVDMLEDYEIVSARKGTQARDVLVNSFELEKVLDKDE